MFVGTCLWLLEGKLYRCRQAPFLMVEKAKKRRKCETDASCWKQSEMWLLCFFSRFKTTQSGFRNFIFLLYYRVTRRRCTLTPTSKKCKKIDDRPWRLLRTIRCDKRCSRLRLSLLKEFPFTMKKVQCQMSSETSSNLLLEVLWRRPSLHTSEVFSLPIYNDKATKSSLRTFTLSLDLGTMESLDFINVFFF